MAEVTVRLFAAAAHAAGVDEVRVAPGPLRDVVAQVRDHAPDTERFDRVLAQCSLLCDGLLTGGAGEAATSTAPIPAGATLDVLPPFAGG